MHDTERRFRALFEQAAVGMTEVDAGGRILTANDRFCEITGYSRDELLAMDSPVEVLTHPEDLEEGRERLERLLRGETDRFEVEKRYRRKDGRTVWVKAAGSAIRDRSGALERLVGVVEDLDRRTKAEEALRKSERWLNAIIHQLPVGVGVLGHDGKLLLGNSLMRRHIPDTLPSRDPERRERWRTVDEQGRPVPPDQWPGARALRGETVSPPMEFHHVDDEGQEWWELVSSAPLRDPDGEVQAAIAVTQDITARKRAEQALRHSEEQRRTALDAAEMGTWEHDVAAGVTHWDARTAELFGMPGMESATIEQVLSLIHEEDRPETARKVEVATGPDSDGRFDAEYRVMLAGGEHRWIRAVGQAMRGHQEGEQQPLRFVGVAFETTEQREAERALRELNQTLEQRVAERTELASRRAEQLQALAVQLTQAEQRERQRLAQILHDNVQQILVATKMRTGRLRGADGQTAGQIGSQLTEMLDEAINASRNLSHELAPHVLYELGLGPALEWLAPRMAEEYGLEVRVAVEEEAEPASEDVKALLYHAIRELLLNVIKHAGMMEAWVRMGRADKGRVSVEVEDRGRGFDPERLDKGGGGKRLGLFGLRERLEALDGEVRIDSVPGDGTRVTLLSPMRAGQPGEAREPHAGEAPAEPSEPVEAAGQTPEVESEAPRRLRVLLADDHRIVRQSLGTILHAEADLELVGEAEDGQQAVELAEDLEPDVVVMDVSMPRMDGIEATGRIMRSRSGTVVIGLSMRSDEQTAGAICEAGAVEHLSKQAATTELVEAIRRHAGRRQQA